MERRRSSNGGPASPYSSLLSGLQQISHPAPRLDEWLGEDNTHERLFALNYSLPAATAGQQHPAPASSLRHSHAPSVSQRSFSQRSCASSMALTHVHMASNASAYAPTLVSASDVATQTDSSVSTGLASLFSGVPLLQEVDGVLTRVPNQHPAVFECAFSFLCCNYMSDDEEEWRMHSLSHFRGEEPPKSVHCPLCDWRNMYNDGHTAWDARMDHMARSHHDLGQTLRTSRPDFHLFQYLWQKRLIDDAELKELKGGNHNLARPPPFTTTEGNGLDRRRDRTNRRYGGGARPLRPA